VTLITRLKRLEQSIQRAAGERRGLGPQTEEDWLAAFEEAGRRGWFDREPDFAKALQFYREALQTAQAQANPPWDPPEDFLPWAQEHPAGSNGARGASTGQTGPAWSAPNRCRRAGRGGAPTTAELKSGSKKAGGEIDGQTDGPAAETGANCGPAG
jgi:hypothetical protein